MHLQVYIDVQLDSDKHHPINMTSLLLQPLFCP